MVANLLANHRTANVNQRRINHLHIRRKRRCDSVRSWSGIDGYSKVVDDVFCSKSLVKNLPVVGSNQQSKFVLGKSGSELGERIVGV